MARDAVAFIFLFANYRKTTYLLQRNPPVSMLKNKPQGLVYPTDER